MRAVLPWLAWVCWSLLCSTAAASTPAERAQLAELDRVRARIADEIHLTAFDLVDEMVYQWIEDPVFDKPTPVVVAGVSVPVGLGTGMQALLENHLASVLGENPTTNIQLVHCPTCTAVVVHSGPEGTVVSRGIDNPAVIEELGEETGRHALFVDIEAEGRFLVLRARLTRLTPDLPIAWSHTLSSSASRPSLLREGAALKSASDARQEYLDALRERGRISIPLRFAVRSYGYSFAGLAPPPPFFYLQSGAELAATDARVWTANFMVGYAFIPQAYQGVMGQTRVQRLVSGRARSLTRPDLYLFVGGAVYNLWGPGVAPFLTPEESQAQAPGFADGFNPRTTFGAIQVGGDLRLGNRIGVSTVLETLPAAGQRNAIASQVVLLGVQFHTWGMEVTAWF